MLKDLVKRCNPLPANSKLLILGGGFTGQHIAALSRVLGCKAICSRRKLNRQGADIEFDSNEAIFPNKESLKEVTHLISCIPPSQDGKDPVITCLGKELKQMPLQWAGYLSTTGVYGNCNGEWVSENDLPKPEQPRSHRRLACEQAWQKSGLPVQILRLPGIYGPGRSAFESIRKPNCKVIHKPRQVFSRIHVDDIAGATFHLIHLAANGKKPSIINIADDFPTTNIEVLRFAASLIEINLPAIEEYDVAAKTMSPMALSFWQENRRVSNQLLCQELGYKLIHKNYKTGLLDCLKQNTLNI